MSLTILSSTVIRAFFLFVLFVPGSILAQSAPSPKPKVISATPSGSVRNVASEKTGYDFKQKSESVDSSATDEAVLFADKETVSFRLPSVGWVVVTQKINKVQSIIEFAPAGHTAQDWRELISFQSYLVPDDVTVDEFARQISDHWVANCKNVQNAILQKDKLNGYPMIMGMTDCPQASYSLVPEYMMYVILRGEGRLHLVQRSVRGLDMNIDDDKWIKFFDSVNMCKKTDNPSKDCKPN